MADDLKGRENLGWVRENQILKHWTGFSCFIVGPIMELCMVSKIREILEWLGIN
jgi:hypothetical protein